MLLAVLAVLILLGAAVYVEFVLLRGRTPEIGGDRSIASLEEVELGGAKQWILIRGRDRRNPVVLWLHGGPGMPAMYLAHAFQRQMERDFVIVQWDRLGAGKSYASAGDASISVSGRLSDTIELTRLLRERFGQDRIYLLGHSWGSYLGLLAAHEHPEYYRAFVGSGVIAGTRAEADSLRRRWLREEAEENQDSTLLARLAAGEEVTEADVFRYGGSLAGARSFWPLLRIGLAAPEYTLFDALAVRKGVQLVHERMQYDVLPGPLEGEYDDFAVPVAFFLGRHDHTTPSALAAAYLERLEAPYKEKVWFEESAHFPFLTQSQRFSEKLVELEARIRELDLAGPDVATLGQASSAPRSFSNSRSTDR
jgi:pimeloyl-ACP methyl ester carboxylesterase